MLSRVLYVERAIERTVERTIEANSFKQPKLELVNWVLFLLKPAFLSPAFYSTATTKQQKKN